MALNVRGSDSLWWSTGIDTGGLKEGAKKATGIISDLKSKITKADVFGALAVGALYSFGRIVQGATEMAKQLEQALAEVTTISTLVSENLEGVSERMVRMSTRFPDNAEMLTKALYQIVSAGYDTAQMFDILEESAKLATATVSDTFTAADAITYIMNAYGESAGNAANISDRLFTIVRLGKTTMRELGPEIGMITGLAAQAGVTFDELSAILAESVKTLKTPIAVTGIRGILAAILTPTDDALRMSKALGIEFNITAIRTEGFVTWLQKLMKATDGSAEALSVLFPNIRGLTGLLSVATDEGGKLTASMNAITASTGAMDTAYEKMMTSTENRGKIFKNNLVAILHPIGAMILDFMNLELGAINKIFDELDKRRLEHEKKSAKTVEFWNELLRVDVLKAKDSPGGLVAGKGMRVSKIDTEIDTEKQLSKLKKTMFELGIEVEKVDERFLALHVATGPAKWEILKGLIDDITGSYEKLGKEKESAIVGPPLPPGWVKPAATGTGVHIPTLAEIDAAERAREQAKKDEEDRIKATREFVQERSDMMEEAREEDDKYYEWQTHRSEDSLKAEISRIEKEIAMHGEAWSYKMGWIEDLDAKKKELAGKEKDRNDKERDEIEAIADIQKTYADNMQKYLEKRAKETEDIYRELASFIGDIDSDLGKAIRNVGEILTLVSMIRKEGTSSIAQATGAIGILGSAFSILQMFTGGSGISQYEQTMSKLADDTERLQKAQALMVGEAVVQGYKDIEVSVKSRVAEISKELLVWQAYQAALGKKDALGALGMNAQSHIDQLNTDLADTKIELDEIQQKLETTLTGTTADSITDAIAEGFENGLSEAEVFAKTFNQLMAAALKDAFKRAMMDKVITQWYTQFSTLAESGLTADEMKILSESLRTGFADITTLWDSIAVIAQQAGVSLTDTTGTAATGMTGAIAGITEETAGLLAGQFQNLIMNSVRIRETVGAIEKDKLGFMQVSLAEIQAETYYLDDIYARSDMSLNALVEIRNGAYYLDDIYNRLAPVSNINDNISLMLMVAQDNLKENRRTANNTEHLKGIALTMKTSGYNSLPRSIGA